MPMEHEAKFILRDLKKIRAKLVAMSGEFRGRVFETNVRYEDVRNSLIKRGMLLRLRQDERVRLTFKSPSVDNHTDVKSMNEIEVTVSDFDAMNRILTAIGFHKAQVYEKWRETIILEDAELCLDTMPFGDFLEIESTPAQIKAIALKLGLAWKRRVLGNYLTIFACLKEWERLAFNDVSFDNFKTVSVDLMQYAPKLEAGE